LWPKQNVATFISIKNPSFKRRLCKRKWQRQGLRKTGCELGRESYVQPQCQSLRITIMMKNVPIKVKIHILFCKRFPWIFLTSTNAQLFFALLTSRIHIKRVRKFSKVFEEICSKYSFAYANFWGKRKREKKFFCRIKAHKFPRCSASHRPIQNAHLFFISVLF
jgi:hypothetical protein